MESRPGLLFDFFCWYKCDLIFDEPLTFIDLQPNVEADPIKIRNRSDFETTLMKMKHELTGQWRQII